jgi:hypothetical protein
MRIVARQCHVGLRRAKTTVQTFSRLPLRGYPGLHLETGVIE